MLESSRATAKICSMNLGVKNSSAEDLKIERHPSEFILICRVLQIDLFSDELVCKIKALKLSQKKKKGRKIVKAE